MNPLTSFFFARLSRCVSIHIFVAYTENVQQYTGSKIDYVEHLLRQTSDKKDLYVSKYDASSQRLMPVFFVERSTLMEIALQSVL